MRQLSSTLHLMGLLLVSQVLAQEPAKVNIAKLHPFSGIEQSALQSFTGWNGIIQLTAMASTPMLIYSGADTRVHNFYVQNRKISPYTIPAVWGGYIGPLVASTSLLTYGWTADNLELYRAGCIIAQASLMSFTYQSLLKLVSGREAPDSVLYTNNTASKQFHFGFNRGGIDWGFPSGLMMMNTSSLVALNIAYPHKPLLQVTSAVWLGYTLFSNPAHEVGQLAWFSDALAGTLLGLAIGRSVGNTFTQGESSLLQKHVSLLPILGPAQGAALQVVF